MYVVLRQGPTKLSVELEVRDRVGNEPATRRKPYHLEPFGEQQEEAVSSGGKVVIRVIFSCVPAKLENGYWVSLDRTVPQGLKPALILLHFRHD